MNELMNRARSFSRPGAESETTKFESGRSDLLIGGLVMVAQRRDTPHLDKLTIVLAALGAFCALAVVDSARFFDRDEGYHAMAAEFVREGRVPWRDFLYLHPPGLPWILAPFGGDPFVLRWVATAAAALAVGLLTAGILRTAGRTAAMLAAGLLITHPFFLSWMGTVKTYTFVASPAIAATLVLAHELRRRPENRSLVALVGSALLFGSAATIRLPCVAMGLLGSGWLLLSDRSWRGIAHTALFAGTCLLIPAVAAVLVGASWPQIWFNLVASHNEPTASPWGDRWHSIRQLIEQPQVLVLILAGVATSFLHKLRGGSHDDCRLALAMAVLLTIGYLFARPSYPQYWTFALPFWIWSIVPILQRAGQSRAGLGAVLGASLLWVASSVLAKERILAPYPSQNYFSRSEVAGVRRAIKDLPRGVLVASIWPGFVSGTGQRPAPGLENTLGFESAAQLSAETRRTLRVLSEEEFRGLVLAGGFDALVITTEDAERLPFLQSELTHCTIEYSTERIMMLKPLR